MKQTELLNTYQSASGKACYVEFLMRYAIDQYMDAQNIPQLRGSVKKDNGSVKAFIIKNAWDKNCLLEEVQEQIIKIFDLSDREKKNLILSREVRTKLFNGDFFGLAKLLDIELKGIEFIPVKKHFKNIIETDDRMECLNSLEKTSNQAFFQKCETIFDETIGMLIKLQGNSLLKKNNF